MGGWTLRVSVRVGVGALLLGFPAAMAEAASAPRAGASLDENVIVIPQNWRDTYPFFLRFAEAEGAEHVIDLAAARFATDGLVDLSRNKSFREPDLSTFPASSVRQAFASGRRDLFIVQAADPKAQITLRRLLERARIPILGYIPHDAYLVRLDPRTHSLLSAQEAVFWIGLFQPAYRVAPDLDFILEADPVHRLKMLLRLDPETYGSEADVRATLGTVSDAGVVDVARASRDWIVRVDGPVSLARSLALLPGCLWVERFVDVQLHNNVARTSASVTTGRGAAAGPIMDVEDVWARGIRGEGQIAAAADTGLSTGNIAAGGNMHTDFGQAGSATNPMRVVKGYALNDRATWNDDQAVGGGHGTHTSGSIVGNGIRSGSTPSTNTFPTTSYAGTAPKAQFVFQSVLYADGSLRTYTDLNNLFLPPYNDGARVHSNSWGSPVGGQYTTASQTLDEFVWNHKDMVITFSAGNSGEDGTRWDGVSSCAPTGQPIDGVVDTDSIGSPGTAKNCITVGASENYRPNFAYQSQATDSCSPLGTFNQRAWGWGWCYTTNPIFSDKICDNASGMAPFSSRGPTDDLRIKPDLVAPGAVVASTRTNVNQAFADWGECEIPAGQQTYYVNMGGTSMSNPLTAGAATLVRQYYVGGWHANDSDVSESIALPAQGFNPSAALVKATLMNGAWDMAPGQYGTSAPQPETPSTWDRAAGRDLPNNGEGYGRVDLEASLFPYAGWGRNASRRMHVRDVTTGIGTGGRNSYSQQVTSSADPLIVTLAWTDPWATAGAGTKLVNDLDLEVTSPSGRRYRTNRVDTYDPTFVPDNLNNVEQVKVTAPETGAWTIDVAGANVPGNGVSGTTTQPFALVVSAVSCLVAAGPPTGVTAVAANNRIDVSWNAVGGATEYYVYRGTAAGQATALVATVAAPATTFVDAPLAGGVTYYYVVTATSGAGCDSSRSVEVSATATGACNLPPTFGGLVSVTSPVSSPCALNLAWTAATASCGGPVSYNVYRSTTTGFTPGVANRIAAALPAATLAYSDSSALVPGTTYYYVVRATDEANGVQEGNTVERSAVPAGNTTLYSQTFDGFADGNLAGWTRGFSIGSAVDWRGVMTCTAHSGAKVFRFGGTTCAASYTPGAWLTQAYARTPSIAVAAGSTNVRLSFWHRWSFDTFFDGGYLEITLDGTTYNYVFPSAILANGYTGTNDIFGVMVWNGDHSSAFVNTVVDLDAACDSVPGNTGGCAGKTVQIAFTTVNDDFNNFPGWFIDDVQVTRDVAGSCSVAPQPVPFLSARATPGTNLLEWRNPASGAYGSAVVRYAAGTTPPATVTAGTALACPGQNTALGAYNSCSHAIATGTYSYSLFVDNGSAVYSSRRSVTATQFAAGVRKWAYSTGAANLAPAGILPGAVGTGGVFGLSNDRVLHAMDPTAAGGAWPRTGSFDWTPAAMNGPAQHRPPVVPLAAGPRVFLASQDGHAYAVDARTGAPLWTSDRLGDVLQASPAGLFSDIRPTAPDRLFVGTRNAMSANTLFALDPATGTTLAQFDNGGGANAIGIITGITVDYDTNYVYFTSRASATGSPDTLWCVDATGGALNKVWSLAVGDIDGSPVVHLGRLYVGINTGLVRAIDLATRAVVWTYTCSPADGPIKGYVFPHFGSSPLRLYFSTNTRVWAIVDNGSSASLSRSVTTVTNPSTPLYVNDTTYLLVASSNGTLYQLRTADLSTAGSVSLGTALGSPARDTVNGMFHVGSTAGVLHAVTLPVP